MWGEVQRSRQNRLVLLTESSAPITDPPIFIVACPRSGSSLLRRIIDSHSRIACPPESHFLRPVLDGLADRRSMVGLESMGFGRDVVLARTRVFVERFFLDYAAANTKARWADKTPLYVDYLDQLDELFAGTPRYVMLYRHGLDVAFSLTEVFGEDLYTLTPATSRDDHKLIRTAARYWSDRVERMQRFQRAHPDRTMAVRYDRLVTEPLPVLQSLFAFLGEPFEAQTLDFNAQHHDDGLEDGRVRSTKTFQPSIDNYRRWAAAEIQAAAQEAGASLENLGFVRPR